MQKADAQTIDQWRAEEKLEVDPGVAVGLFILAFFIWGVPLILVASDPNISRKEKSLWIFAVGLASWFGWLLYQYVSPILPTPTVYRFDNRETRRRVPPTF